VTPCEAKPVILARLAGEAGPPSRRGWGSAGWRRLQNRLGMDSGPCTIQYIEQARMTNLFNRHSEFNSESAH